MKQSRRAAILYRAKEMFSEDSNVYEALREWFEFKDGPGQTESLLERLAQLADKAEAKAESDIDHDDRFGDPNE